MKSFWVAFLALIFLGACSHTPKFTPQDKLCNITRYSLETSLPGERPLSSVIAENPGNMLLLSGGSQNGAFGVGFLDGWHKSGTMPNFRLVTGISTGALQSTGAFIGRPEISVNGYTIDDEGRLLVTYVDGSDVDDGFSPKAIYKLLTKGAISDLIPLRDRLDEIMTDEVLREVADRYRDPDNRSYLLAGATDVDLGVAVAFDMTKIAFDYAEAKTKADRDRHKDCYIEALVASSIVPPGARPSFIDNRMYIDGGVRYAVFDDRFSEVLRPSPVNVPVRTGDRHALYLILNASGDSREECQKVNPDDCTPERALFGQRKDWEVLDLAVRTLELFENQIRRLSVDRARERARNQNLPFFFARIRNQDLSDPHRRYSIPDFEDQGPKTCEEWRSIDDAQDDPVEFHRRFMRCLIEYGRDRAREAEWDEQPR
ncbi:putative lipoprotein [Erythrobacter sp. NAP1]|uniref:patatin-like phospholipase family protein n=1 Tax=Erythrobacter sp. NAP1 TaxID=237727 RepID=UPI0000687919|nr:patatin-like phospholipase family protein [Erythrobacter sp. NAP1]EAQ28381.1 putative lipoprotein [Erythrobacter sp. NAP1]